MRKYFYIGVILLFLFEIVNVFFIMPIPGSQDMDSIRLAYFLFTWKWIFRIVFLVMIMIGLVDAWKQTRALTLLSLFILVLILFGTNFIMRADRMFYEPEQFILESSLNNKVAGEKLVLGVEHNGEAIAFPINYLGYHHKVYHTLSDKSIIATYCTVCRTGRVFENKVNGKAETFRLVGMDHFNALFEDKTTKSWWRQVSGEAIVGKMKGHQLPEYPFIQTTLKEWLILYPNSKIMQPDPAFQEEYDAIANIETGKETGRLHKLDTTAWEDKSWVAGIQLENGSKAYDWNLLVDKQIINDEVVGIPIVVFVADDDKSLFAFRRLYPEQQFSINHDTLTDGISKYNFLGKPFNEMAKQLSPITVSQEYWHSWRTFHPNTQRYE